MLADAGSPGSHGTRPCAPWWPSSSGRPSTPDGSPDARPSSDQRRSTAEPPSAPRPARAARRAQLLDAAVDAIRDLGPGVTMEQLASAGGVTKPILYRHFGDRDGLINAIAERFSADLLTLGHDARWPPTPPPASCCASTVDSYVGFIERETEPLPLHGPAPARAPGRAAAACARSSTASPSRWRWWSPASACGWPGATRGAAVPWAYGIVGLVHQAGDWWVDDQTMTREAAGRLPRRAALGRPRVEPGRPDGGA